MFTVPAGLTWFRKYVTGMPFTSALTDALPSTGLPPHVHDMTLTTLSARAASPTSTTASSWTSPLTPIVHPRGFARSIESRVPSLPHSAADAPPSLFATSWFGVMTACENENVPCTTAGFWSAVATRSAVSAVAWTGSPETSA